MTAPVFVDTNIWVYALIATTDPRHGKACAWLATLDQPVINGQVLRELGRVLLSKAEIDEDRLRAILRQIQSVCRTAPDSLEVLLSASRLRETHRLSYWDSLIVAAAMEAGCATLYSEDMQNGQVIGDRLAILNPLLP
ncbi:MAG TPA: PIN domain-containing protein [Methylococcaceae bacterium]|nr:PIN domain-containing protein [Methylococcaceae bacterium]